MNLTDEQKRAVEDVERNLVVRAGAGTGKTRVLVSRFLYLLERRLTRPTDIAAITYTEKAANELKVRLRAEALERERSSGGDGNRRYWRECRLEIERARIGTFHGFCARLLREQALQAGLDPNFVVLEEANAFIRKRRAVQRTLNAWVERSEEALVPLLRAFEFGHLEGLLNDMLSRPEICEPAAQRFLAMRPEGLAEWWDRERQRIQTEAVRGLLDDPRWQRCLDELSHYQATDPQDKAELNRRCILRLAEELPGTDEPYAILRQMGTACNRRLGVKKHWRGDELAMLRELFRTMKQEVIADPLSAVAAVEATERDDEAAAGFCALGRLYLDVRAAYRQEKEAEGALDYDDLLLRTRDLLRGNRPVRAHYQKSISRLLVDEFQDNADVEREVLFFLAEKSPRADDWRTVELAEGKLFIVGDDKQSIYRFRGADVAVFNETAERLSASDRYALSTSFRATPALIDFVNEFFSSVMGEGKRKELFQSRYAPLVAHRPTDKGPAPGVELLMTPVARGETMQEARTREARALARRIARLVEAEPVVVDSNVGESRPAKLSEVVVLFRALSNVELYERALREAGLSYYLVGGTDFYQRQEVRDVVTALRTVLSPDDELALAGWLRSPMCGISDEGLWFLARKEGLRRGLARAEEHLRGHPDLEPALRAREMWKDLRSGFGRLGLTEAVEQLLVATGYSATVQTSFSGSQQRANLEQLVELARTVEAAGGTTLREFVELLEEFSIRGPREEAAATVEEAGDAVRLMSIHQAKGLEFPVVCVADLGRGEQAGQRQVLMHPELGFACKLKSWEDSSNGDALPWRLLRQRESAETEAERERLLYVAITRARDYLVLSGPWYEEPTRRQERSWIGWLRSGLPEGMELPEPGLDTEVPFGGTTVRLRHGMAEAPEGTGLRRRSAAGWRELGELEGRRSRHEGQMEALSSQLSKLRVAPGAQASLPATAVADFARCPRYYRFSHVLGLPETVLSPPGPYGEGGMLLGKVVHEVLRYFPEQPDEELRRRVRDTVATCTQGRVSSGDDGSLPRQAEDLVRRWLSTDLAAEIREGRAWRSEVPVSFRLDGRLIEGRIDLVWVDQDGRVGLLDYKTDAVTAEEVAGRKAYLIRQLQVYWLALARLLGRPPARALLVFLRPGIEIELPRGLETEAVAEELTRLLRQMSAGPYPERHGPGCPCRYACFCEDDATSGG